MKAIVKEIIVHLMFLLLCLFVAYAAMDPAAFLLANSLKALCAHGGIKDAYQGGAGPTAEEVSLDMNQMTCVCFTLKQNSFRFP